MERRGTGSGQGRNNGARPPRRADPGEEFLKQGLDQQVLVSFMNPEIEPLSAKIAAIGKWDIVLVGVGEIKYWVPKHSIAMIRKADAR